MAQVTNFVPKLSIFRNLRRRMSYPIFGPSNPLLGPETHPYPSKYLTKHVFFCSPPSKWWGVSLFRHIEGKLAKFGKTSQNPLRWHMMDVPKRNGLVIKAIFWSCASMGMCQSRFSCRPIFSCDIHTPRRFWDVVGLQEVQIRNSHRPPGAVIAKKEGGNGGGAGGGGGGGAICVANVPFLMVGTGCTTAATGGGRGHFPNVQRNFADTETKHNICMPSAIFHQPGLLVALLGSSGASMRAPLQGSEGLCGCLPGLPHFQNLSVWARI